MMSLLHSYRVVYYFFLHPQANIGSKGGLLVSNEEEPMCKFSISSF